MTSFQDSTHSCTVLRPPVDIPHDGHLSHLVRSPDGWTASLSTGARPHARQFQASSTSSIMTP